MPQISELLIKSKEQLMGACINGNKGNTKTSERSNMRKKAHLGKFPVLKDFKRVLVINSTTSRYHPHQPLSLI